MAFEVTGSTYYTLSPASFGPDVFTMALFVRTDTDATYDACIPYNASSFDQSRVRTRTPNPTQLQTVNQGILATSIFGGSVAINTWTHIAGMARSSADRSVFVDASETNDTTSNAGLDVFNRMQIGQFQGRQANFALWSVVLTAAEIASLSKGFSPRRVRPQSLLAYAPLIREAVEWAKGLAMSRTGPAPTYGEGPRLYGF